MSERPTAPIETRHGGFDGETKDGKADVSRETSELTDAQAMLNEIMDRSMPEVPDLPEEDAEENAANSGAPIETRQDVSHETSNGETPPLAPPRKNRSTSVFTYLAVLFGAAFLMLLLAYFVQQRNNAAAMDDLRMTTNASKEELVENIKALEAEQERLQAALDEQKEQLDDKNSEISELELIVDDINDMLRNQTNQNRAQRYLWYIGQFIDSRDYTMAAAAILFSADHYRQSWHFGLISINSAQLEQYEAYRQELIDKGYLQLLDPNSGDLCFTEKWDPSTNEDTAALSILWFALDKHFVEGDDNGASQYLYHYPLSDPDTGYQERVARMASKFTLEQFQLLKDELVVENWLIVAEDGTMSENTGTGQTKTDVLYGLPFKLPGELSVPPTKFKLPGELFDPSARPD